MSFAAYRFRRSLDRFIARRGEPVTLQRVASDASGALTVAQSLTCPAHVRETAPQDLLEGGVRDIRVVLSGTSLGGFGVPARDDRVLIQGGPSSIVEIEPIRYKGELVRVNLLCRG